MQCFFIIGIWILLNKKSIIEYEIEFVLYLNQEFVLYGVWKINIPGRMYTSLEVVLPCKTLMTSPRTAPSQALKIDAKMQ